jgi:hypothetical protein
VAGGRVVPAPPGRPSECPPGRRSEAPSRDTWLTIFLVSVIAFKNAYRRHRDAMLPPVLRIRIRIHRIHMFLGLPDPDPLVRGMDPDPALDPDPSIIMQK